jgi:hypothetical protein
MITIAECNNHPFYYANQIQSNALADPQTGQTPAMERQMDSKW